MKNIVLIGMMGCGKTTIAKLLSKKLNRKYIDIDDYLVEKYQMTISEMFEISEENFREKETLCCQEVGMLKGTIISTGGGVIKNKKNIDALHQNGLILYVDRPIAHIYNDIDVSSRPLLKDGPEKLYELYEQRHQLYLQFCDYHIYNDGSLAEIVDKIIKVYQEQ